MKEFEEVFLTESEACLLSFWDCSDVPSFIFGGGLKLELGTVKEFVPGRDVAPKESPEAPGWIRDLGVSGFPRNAADVSALCALKTPEFVEPRKEFAG